MTILCWFFGHRRTRIDGQLFIFCARCHQIVDLWSGR